MPYYKYDEWYRTHKYESLSLRDEFNMAMEYLLFDEEHHNDEVFHAVDEIYHAFCIKQLEVEELDAEADELAANNGVERSRK